MSWIICSLVMRNKECICQYVRQNEQVTIYYQLKNFKLDVDQLYIEYPNGGRQIFTLVKDQ